MFASLPSGNALLFVQSLSVRQIKVAHRLHHTAGAFTPSYQIDHLGNSWTTRPDIRSVLNFWRFAVLVCAALVIIQVAHRLLGCDLIGFGRLNFRLNFMVLRADKSWGWAEMFPHFTSTGDFIEAGQDGILRRLLSNQVCNVLDDVLPVEFSYFGRVGVDYWLRVIFVAHFGWSDWRPWLFNLAEHFRQLLQPYLMHLAFINLLFFALFFSLVSLAFLLL